MEVPGFLAMAITVTGATGAAQDPGPGISQELAQRRAELLSDVRYELDFDLVEGQDEVEGEVVIHFTLSEESLPATPIVLDFGGHDLTNLRVNGVPQDDGVRLLHDHVVVSAQNLDPGQNRIGASFKSRIAPTGTPLTVYRDSSRHEEYLYTLVVPADAHRLFPCFDQPDLKAVFSLRLTVPPKWVAVANAAEKSAPEYTPEGSKRYEFEDTESLSTYLMAFAAGPFEVITGPPEPSRPGTRVFVRGTKLGELDQGALFSMHRRGLRWLEQYFARDYPFGKLDVVLVPGFPYGGMEHAGAIFYRESAIVFDHQPTESELVRRSTLIYHEVSHQWFGNLVTMKWFDDLWLKEGFATFISYHLLDALEPERESWLRFHQRVKPGAYRVDATPGTTPIYQSLANLADAKSAYGAIVYNKAPAVLRELHERIGAREFRDGVRSFLTEHEFENAVWSDLIGALARASGTDLSSWSDRWILAAGMPKVRAQWKVDAKDKVTRFDLVQESVQGDEGTWPLAVELLWIEVSGEKRTIAVDTSRARIAVEEAIGVRAPACVLPNPRDIAYGHFLLDPTSRDYWLRNLPREPDPLRRAVALTSLFDMVRETELAPARYAELVIDLLGTERDALSHAWLLGTLATTLRGYLHAADRQRLTHRVTEQLLAQLREGLPGLELQSFRFLVRASSDRAVTTLCEELLAGREPVPGLQLGRQDQYLALAALIAAGKGARFATTMTGASTPPGAKKYAFLAQAAAAAAATKQLYFETYLHPDDPPEQWMQESLSYFHWPGQDELTLPYLRKALDQVEWVKGHRKIFFMPAWIDAFVNSHSDSDALEIVDLFLANNAALPLDIRRKIVQSADGLRRAVAIKERWK